MAGKIVLLVCDGLGDRPIPELDNQTPLEAAKTPNLDRLAERGITGLMHSLGRGLTPGSDTSHLNLLGYDYREYYSGRGTIEVAGLGMELRHGDVAFRGNMGTVDKDLTIVDRRAGRITDTSPFTKLVDGIEIEGVEFIVKPGTAHRAGIIARGEGLSANVTDNDPHEPGVKVLEVRPKDDTPEARRTADVMNRFLAKAHEILEACDENKARLDGGKLAANYLLIRGAGFYRHVPPFEERFGLKAACIAGGGLYRGVGAYLGMAVLDVPGATALPTTDIRAKFNKVREVLADYDFVFVHVKAADSLGEDGKPLEKRDFIERIDEAAELLLDLGEDVVFVATADHSTPCALMKHSADPVPVMIVGAGVRVDSVTQYNERAVVPGGLGRMIGTDLMPELMNLIGKSKLIGA